MNKDNRDININTTLLNFTYGLGMYDKIEFMNKITTPFHVFTRDVIVNSNQWSSQDFISNFQVLTEAPAGTYEITYLEGGIYGGNPSDLQINLPVPLEPTVVYGYLDYKLTVGFKSEADTHATEAPGFSNRNGVESIETANIIYAGTSVEFIHSGGNIEYTYTDVATFDNTGTIKYRITRIA